ncbi:hypothetical protein SLS62_009464 [Diatrype stigma]|uniref:Uncharacterized protein n=1 Tax=Diatrype stigma TaxID=117547 RepID=A0AAN9UL11_9PEZI
MPSVTQSPAFSSSKKRRRDDNDGGEVQNPFSALGSNNDRLFFSSSSSPSTPNSYLDLGSNHNPPVFNLPRKVIPLPASKRFRALDPDHEGHDRQQGDHQDDDGRLTSPSGQQHHFPHAHPDYSTTPPISPEIQPYHHHQQVRGSNPSTTIKPSAALLDPCHICHRKPTKKSDLDSFADCMGCGQRTCFVCIRQCQGWLASGGGGSSDHPAGEAWRPVSSTITAAAAEEQQQEDISTSFTMEDVDDDMDHHQHHDEAHSADRRPLKSYHLQNKVGGGHGNGVHSGGVRGGPEEGWSGRGHRDVVCSRCCIEKGSEGDVVCLGCLAGLEGA